MGWFIVYVVISCATASLLHLYMGNGLPGRVMRIILGIQILTSFWFLASVVWPERYVWLITICK